MTVKETSPAAAPIDTVAAPEVRAELDLSLAFANLFRIYVRLLPAREARLLQLVVVDRKSYQDAAEQLGVSREDVHRLVFQGRLRLHRAMMPSLDELAG